MTESRHSAPNRVVVWFLAVTYGVGAVVAGFLEYSYQTLSQRFDLPAELIFLTCAVQLVCAIGLPISRFTPWTASVLTVTTLGAVGGHLRIGSPLTAMPALLYSGIQIWVIVKTWPSRTVDNE